MSDDTPTITETPVGEGPISPESESTGLLRGLPGGKRSTPKDTPPRRRSARATRSTSTTKDSPKVADVLPDGAIAKGMAEMYAQIGMFWGMFDPNCGAVLAANAVEMGNSLEAVAKESPAVRDFLQKMVTTSAWGKVIAAHAPVVLAISMHHIPSIQKRFHPGVPEQADAGMSGNQKPGNVA